MAGDGAFGCVIIATGLERDPERAQRVDDHLDALIATATMLDASPVVVVHDGTARVPAPARAFRMPRAERDDLSAVRHGLMQLTNAPVDAALILPIEAHERSSAMLTRMIRESRERGVLLAATATNGSLGFPLFAARDSWRELMTTEGGIEAVLRLQGPRILAIEEGE